MYFAPPYHYPFMKKNLLFLFSIGLLLAQNSFAQKAKNKQTGVDLAIDYPKPYDQTQGFIYKGYTSKSFYLEMRDGVKIAVDLYLPKGIKPGEKIPTILHQTRYWRNVEIRWPFSMFVKTPMGLLGKMIREFSRNGYALVNIDVRGSGASFGQNLYPWSENEVKDGFEICNWIVKQEWSNGSIGTAGASYTGTASEFLLTTQHPAVKADANLYSLFDVYADNAFPGGIHNVWFTSVWGKANRALDDNKLPTKNKKIKMAVRGVKPVSGKGRRKLLKAAVAEHKDNLNVNDGAMIMDYRDEEPIKNVSADKFSPHAFVDKEIATKVPVYSYSGWSDGAYPNAAIKRFLTLKDKQYKLMLGPWEHGGSYVTAPYAQSDASFNHIGELLKFFDFYLKGKTNGLDKEPRVHYFTQVENKWKYADTWPPKGFQTKHFPLKGNQSLALEETSLVEPFSVKYTVDTSAGTGSVSRWESLAGALHTPYVYPDRNERDKKLLVFDSPALTQDMEVTGHAALELLLKSNQGDCSFFVYLEDIDENGIVHYVTEGELRSIHRVVSDIKTYNQIGDWHSFLRKDAKPFEIGKEEKIKIDLLPTSYLFKKGHKIRVAIGGHDKDHFRLMNPNVATWEIMSGSMLELPAK
jgi:putative CocE/NonD family hydrolase